MKGKQFIIWVLAIIMIGAGFSPVMEVVAEELPEAPYVTEVKVMFPGEKWAKYVINKENGCIQTISDEYGDIKPKYPPKWLVEGKKIKYIGGVNNFSNLRSNKLQCRQGIGIIGIGGSPIEYWSEDSNGNPICVGAWDPSNGKWYPRCEGY